MSEAVINTDNLFPYAIYFRALIPLSLIRIPFDEIYVDGEEKADLFSNILPVTILSSICY